jgi:hypothetical protein
VWIIPWSRAADDNRSATPLAKAISEMKSFALLVVLVVLVVLVGITIQASVSRYGNDRLVLRRFTAIACSAAAGIFSAALSFVLLAHPTDLFAAIRDLPPCLFLSAIATAPGLMVIGLMVGTLTPRSRVFAPAVGVIVGGVLGLAVMQCWGNLFGETLLNPDWERGKTLFRSCAACSGSVAMAAAGYVMRTTRTTERESIDER